MLTVNAGLPALLQPCLSSDCVSLWSNHLLLQSLAIPTGCCTAVVLSVALVAAVALGYILQQPGYVWIAVRAAHFDLQHA